MEFVEIKGRSRDNATLLIAAARELGVDEALIRTSSGSYFAPKEVADVAFPPQEKPARAAKKPASKRAASKPKSEE